MNCCNNLDIDFYPYYVFAASRKFLFFIDKNKTKSLNVYKLAQSSVMEELLFLKRLSQYERDMDPSEFQSQISANWFDGNNALKMYNAFANLDKDRNGNIYMSTNN